MLLRYISIHSLYAEGDIDRVLLVLFYSYFNPLPLRRGRRLVSFKCSASSIFQSTPSTQRETNIFTFRISTSVNFNPLPLRRGRHLTRCSRSTSIRFQSTPSTQRETRSSVAVMFVGILFQSTPSTQRETEIIEDAIAKFTISIHSLYAEGDDFRRYNNSACTEISIHSLYAEGDRPLS